MNNVYENVVLGNNAVYKNICIQNEKSEGYFHKYSKNSLESKSKYSSFLFPSGLKFNKLDLEFNWDVAFIKTKELRTPNILSPMSSTWGG